MTLFAFFGSSTRLEKVDPGFKLSALAGKKVACADRAQIERATFPDLDGSYASKVFDATYAQPSLYTGPLADSLCALVVSREGAVRVPSADSADYAFVLESVRIHHRVSLDVTAALQKGSGGNTLARIVVESRDKIGMGGEKRFQKGFETLRVETLKNLRKDYPAASTPSSPGAE
jgi:hypothetical protein